MSKYITVIDSNLDLAYWRAVQWSDTLADIRSNKYYSAGVNMNIPKHNSDQQVEGKSVIEIMTQDEASAVIIKVNSSTTDQVRLANNIISRNLKKQLI